MLVESYGIVRKQFGPKHPRTIEVGLSLIAFYENTARKDIAAEIKADLGLAQ